MHEVGLMSEAVEIALNAAREAGAGRVTAVNMRIGRLAGVVPTALEFAFECVTQGTAAEGAKFTWEEVAVRCRCKDCSTEFEPAGVVYDCPQCGSVSSDIVAGRELLVSDIEVED